MKIEIYTFLKRGINVLSEDQFLGFKFIPLARYKHFFCSFYKKSVFVQCFTVLTDLFADDTAVYLTKDGTDSGRVLQNDLDTLSVWESRWDMEFNPSKCQVVMVTTFAYLTISSCTLSHLLIFSFSTDSAHLSRMHEKAYDSM